MTEDLISISEASRLIGKSEQTIRRWKRDNKISFVPVQGSRKLFISRAAILSLAGQSSLPIQNTTQSNSQDEAMDILRTYLDDTKRERDELRAEIKSLRHQLQDKQNRIDALERELNGGIRGLLMRKIAGR